MDVQNALARLVTRSGKPAITTYELAVLVFELYRKRKYQGKRLSRLQKPYPDRRDLKRHINRLLDVGILEQSAVIKHRDAFLVLGGEEKPAGDLLCSIDPFAYLAHLSAMEFHGLTDRISKVLCIATPTLARWREEAESKMHKDLGEAGITEYLHQDLPPLRQLHLERVKRMPLDIHRSSHRGAFTSARDRPLRVATVGRTFLQMLKQPDRCGGIYHVLEVYEEHAEAYLDLITSEIERNGTAIDKVRAGYVLEEVCGLAHPTIDSWRAYVRRGGSQRLYAPNEYSSQYSATWSLSINI